MQGSLGWQLNTQLQSATHTSTLPIRISDELIYWGDVSMSCCTFRFSSVGPPVWRVFGLPASPDRSGESFWSFNVSVSGVQCSLRHEAHCWRGSLQKCPVGFGQHLPKHKDQCLVSWNNLMSLLLPANTVHVARSNWFFSLHSMPENQRSHIVGL